MFIRLNRKLPLHGGGASERSFIDIADVAGATELAARLGAPGETYHIATDRIVSIRTLVEMICARLGARFEDCVEIAGERPGKDMAYRLDSGKIRRELGWSDTVGLEAGIDRTIAWADRFFEDLKAQPMQYVHHP
jgi:dTDP-glucose 4,6-dehydratase